MGNGPTIGCDSYYYTPDDLLKIKEKQSKEIVTKVHGENNEFKKYFGMS